MDSAMVNNYIFFQTKKGLLLEADKTFKKKVFSLRLRTGLRWSWFINFYQSRSNAGTIRDLASLTRKKNR